MEKGGSKKTKNEGAKEEVRELGADNDGATKSVMEEVERGNEKNKERQRTKLSEQTKGKQTNEGETDGDRMRLEYKRCACLRK